MHRKQTVSLSVLACIPLLAACAMFNSVTSVTTIEPSKAFRLGGGQSGPFTVRGRNAGRVAVVVYSELAGKRDSILTLAPGAPVDAQFGANATAVFRNTSSAESATVSIKVTGDVQGLGMRYETTPKRR